MAQTYCSSCGKPNLYTFQPPKWCGFCSSELAKLETSNISTKPKPNYPKIQEIEQDSDLEHVDSEQLAENAAKGIKVSVEQVGEWQSLKNVLYSSPGQSVNRPIPNKKETKQALQNFKDFFKTKRSEIGDSE